MNPRHPTRTSIQATPPPPGSDATTLSSLGKVIPLVDYRERRLPMTATPAPALPPQGLLDRLERPLRDLRISVTDRCNFRCTYCMPREKFGRDHAFLPPAAHLSFDEITRLARQFVALGVKKIRLTGGEPLLRKNLPQLIEQLARLRTIDGERLDIALTTNGSLLARQASDLKLAGLQRITVSLDALDETVFARINDVDFKAAAVLRGIEAAQQVGLAPIKINMVVQRGINESQILPMAQHFRGTGMALRLIEYMDVGNNPDWRLTQVLPSSEVLSILQAAYHLHPATLQRTGETATRWRYADGQGEIGLISSVSHAFCGDCNRARISADGQLFSCLFAHQGHDLRTLLRNGCSDDLIQGSIAQLWTQRQDRYSEQRAAQATRTDPVHQRVEMHVMGG
jgi:cyclic pyranopterin phosphate synthase